MKPYACCLFAWPDRARARAWVHALRSQHHLDVRDELNFRRPGPGISNYELVANAAVALVVSSLAGLRAEESFLNQELEHLDRDRPGVPRFLVYDSVDAPRSYARGNFRHLDATDPANPEHLRAVAAALREGGVARLPDDVYQHAYAYEQKHPVARALACFGRVGVLVDDSEFSPCRIARELYGTDTLPEWWVVARDITTGAALLGAAADRLTGCTADAVFVVDRFLPLRIGERAVPWDEERHEHEGEAAQTLEAFRAAFTRVTAACEGRSNRVLAPLTGMPYPGRQLHAHAPSWNARGPESLRRLRGSLRKGLPDALTFGPAPEADEPGAKRAPDFPCAWQPGRSDTRARWNLALDELCEHLRSARTSTCVLIAGVEGVAPHRWSDLDDIVERLQTLPVEAHREGLAGLLQRRTIPGAQYGRSHVLGQLTDALRTSDQGFPFAHWLLALLPWKAVISTSAGDFFGRAARAARVAAPKHAIPDGNDITRSGKQGALYTPVMDAVRRVADSRGHDEANLGVDLAKAFKKATTTHGGAGQRVVVVVGDPLLPRHRGVELAAAVTAWLGEHGDLLHVDPTVADLARPEDDTHPEAAWGRLLGRATRLAASDTSRLPGGLIGTADGFAHDLYHRWLTTKPR